jgi:integrase
MPKLNTRPPRYCHHKSSGQAVVKFGGRTYYLGKHGSPESKARYQEAIAQWGQQNRQSIEPVDVPRQIQVPTVAQLILRYYKHALSYYRNKQGESTGTAERMKPVLRLLRANYGNTLVSDFGPLALQRLQEKMVELDWSRTYVNMNTARVKRMFRWGTAQELVPAGVMQRLDAVQGLKAGRTEAREMPAVEPVTDEVVEATLPYLPSVVADMVRFQRLVGCRPTEACLVRPCDVDRSGDVWVYTPSAHKVEHHNRPRAIFIGPGLRMCSARTSCATRQPIALRRSIVSANAWPRGTRIGGLRCHAAIGRAAIVSESPRGSRANDIQRIRTTVLSAARSTKPTENELSKN